MDRSDQPAPIERARTLPARWYRDPSVGEAERERVFARSWLAACRRDEVAEPGSFRTVELAGEPLLIARDERGTARAFYNVCRHHAAAVEPAPCGRAGRFRCPYHGWTYALDGRLLGTPDFDGVEDFRKDENGLAPVRAVEFGPWVWVRLEGDSPGPNETFAPFAERTDLDALGRLRFAERREYELACDWKVFVDNYLDGGYHVPVAHPDLAGLLDYSGYRTEVFPFASVQTSPLVAAEGDPTASVRAGDAAYWWVWPNFMVNLYDGVMDTNLVLPAGPQRCRVVFEFFFDDRFDAGRRARSVGLAERVQQEDIRICESVQRGLRSRSFDTGRYSAKREAGMHHFHRLLTSYLSDA